MSARQVFIHRGYADPNGQPCQKLPHSMSAGASAQQTNAQKQPHQENTPRSPRQFRHIHVLMETRLKTVLLLLNNVSFTVYQNGSPATAHSNRLGSIAGRASPILVSIEPDGAWRPLSTRADRDRSNCLVSVCLPARPPGG